MTQQVINIGSAPDDGTGDPTRTAFNKTNQNFTELYARSSGAPVGAEYITSTADATLTSERVLTDTTTVTWDRTTAGQIKATAVSSGGGTSAPQGRLTLQSGVPVMTTTQSAKTTLYYTPYQGNSLPIYDGTNFAMSAFSELSALTTDTAKSPAAIGVSKVNDWFVWNDAGTLRLGHGPDWTSDTVRSAGTALVMVNGILLNAVAITNGPAIQRGTYVGTTRSNASSQLAWIYGSAAVNGTPGFLGIWNAYNRVSVSSYVANTTASWTYASTAWQQTAGSGTMQTSFVTGLAIDVVNANYNGFGNGTVAAGRVGIGLDSTTVPSGITGYIGPNDVSTVARFDTVVLGYHTLASLERADNPTATFYGVNSSVQTSGLIVNMWM